MKSLKPGDFLQPASNVAGLYGAPRVLSDGDWHRPFIARAHVHWRCPDVALVVAVTEEPWWPDGDKPSVIVYVVYRGIVGCDLACDWRLVDRA